MKQEIERIKVGNRILFQFAPELSFSPEQLRVGYIIKWNNELVLQYRWEGITLKSEHFRSFKII